MYLVLKARFSTSIVGWNKSGATLLSYVQLGKKSKEQNTLGWLKKKKNVKHISKLGQV